MRCSNCGFITQEKVDRCPYCGANIPKPTLSDVRIPMGKYYFSLKVFIPFVVVNILAILIALDLTFYYTMGNNFHIAPWSSLGLFGIVLVLDSFVFRKEKNNHIFIKTMLYFNGIALLFSLSYMNDASFLNTGVRCYQFIFSYGMPVVIVLYICLDFSQFVVAKKFNLLTSFLAGFATFLYTLTLFILMVTQTWGIGYDLPSIVLISLSMAFSAMMAVSNAVFSLYRMTTRTIKEEYDERHN